MPTFRRAYKCVPRQLRALFVVFLTLLAIMALVVPTYLEYQKEGGRGSASQASYQFNPAQEMMSTDKDQLNLLLKVVSIDPQTSVISISARVIPSGRFASSQVDRVPSMLSSSLEADQKIQLTIGEKASMNFSAGDIIPTTSFQVQLYDGQVNNYPFDVYETLTMYRAKLINANGRSTDIEIGLYIDGSIPNWSIRPQLMRQQSSTSLLMSLAASRSTTTKGFAIFTVILLWLLSLSALGVTMDVLIRKRKLDTFLLATFVSMIFALPALRNAIPGAPAIGAGIDILGFFWNMALVGGSALVMISLYILKYEDPKLKVSNRSYASSERSLSPRTRMLKTSSIISSQAETLDAAAHVRDSVVVVMEESEDDARSHTSSDPNNTSAVKNAKFTFGTPIDDDFHQFIESLDRAGDSQGTSKISK